MTKHLPLPEGFEEYHGLLSSHADALVEIGRTDSMEHDLAGDKRRDGDGR